MSLSKFQNLRNELNATILEREDEITIVLTALLAGENVVFVGPPGTAKSMLCDSIVQFLNGTRFSVILNKLSKQEEVFGPVNVAGLKNGVYERVITNMLPVADVAFLDEIFKASSAILNTTLKVLNEKVYDNGLSRVKCPLKLCMAASNEWPLEAKELGALFDRFLFRKYVEPVKTKASIRRLMSDKNLTPVISDTIDAAELEEDQLEARNIPISDETMDVLLNIRESLAAEKVFIGDRRLRKSMTALQCHAWLEGNSEVTTDDMGILSHIWWANPEQYTAINDKICEIAKPSGVIASQMLGECNEILRNTKATDIGESAKALKKISSILRDLKKLGDSPKVLAAIGRIQTAQNDFKRLAVESVGT